MLYILLIILTLLPISTKVTLLFTLNKIFKTEIPIISLKNTSDNFLRTKNNFEMLRIVKEGKDMYAGTYEMIVNLFITYKN